MNFIYIGGLLEDPNSHLAQALQGYMNKNHYNWKSYFPFSSDNLGKKSFKEIIKSLEKLLSKSNDSNIIITHSLGFYIGSQIKNNVTKFFFLDPSLPPQEMFKHILKEEGEKNYCIVNNSNICISNEFKKSINSTPDIESIINKSLNHGTLHFIGTENGGHKISKDYYKKFKNFHRDTFYTFIKDSDHNFSSRESQDRLIKFIDLKIKKT